MCGPVEQAERSGRGGGDGGELGKELREDEIRGRKYTGGMNGRCIRRKEDVEEDEEEDMEGRPSNSHADDQDRFHPIVWINESRQSPSANNVRLRSSVCFRRCQRVGQPPALAGLDNGLWPPAVHPLTEWASNETRPSPFDLSLLISFNFLSSISLL